MSMTFGKAHDVHSVNFFLSNDEMGRRDGGYKENEQHSVTNSRKDIAPYNPEHPSTQAMRRGFNTERTRLAFRNIFNVRHDA